MNRVAMPIAVIVTTIALFIMGVAPVHAADCPQPSHMILVTIDVKPGSYPNPINLKSQGVIPVALLGSAELDVTNVDLGTVRFHPEGRCEQAVAAVRYAFENVNRDVYLDIVFHFAAREVGLQAGDSAACLHGHLHSGEHFCGHDAIVVTEY